MAVGIALKRSEISRECLLGPWFAYLVFVLVYHSAIPSRFGSRKFKSSRRYVVGEVLSIGG